MNTMLMISEVYTQTPGEKKQTNSFVLPTLALHESACKGGNVDESLCSVLCGAFI